jgi:hypothetical protein
MSLVEQRNGRILIEKLQNMNIAKFDVEICFHARKQWILAKEGSPHFLLWNGCMMP